MRWQTALMVFAITWWIVLFMVLPWGNRAIATEDVAKGHADGAPERPRILIKFAVTTAISAVVFAVFYWAHAQGYLSVQG